FHTTHFPASFYPKKASPGEVVVEARVPPAVVEELQSRGHTVKVVPGWSLNFTTAVAIDPERGLLEGAASSRGERNYALGW
ncbi:MAG: gamma-glutamyltransferase, partial [Armatimonadetes bacterium]|nr:gamma-glutamyltransferase [Armatimonadota bacterium]